MNITLYSRTDTGVQSASQITRSQQQIEDRAQEQKLTNIDSVTISDQGMAELKSLLSSAKSARQLGSDVRTIEQRANTIVMSKVLSLYAAQKR